MPILQNGADELFECVCQFWGVDAKNYVKTGNTYKYISFLLLTFEIRGMHTWLSFFAYVYQE